MSYQDDIKVYKHEKAYFKMCKSYYRLFCFKCEMFIFDCKSFLGIRYKPTQSTNEIAPETKCVLFLQEFEEQIKNYDEGKCIVPKHPNVDYSITFKSGVKEISVAYGGFVATKIGTVLTIEKQKVI